MRLRPFFVASALLALSAAAACTLNPQPLPPEDNAATDKGQDGGTGFGTADAGATNQPETPPPAATDASQTDGHGDGAAAVDDGGSDAGTDGGDAGAADGGDAGGADAG